MSTAFFTRHDRYAGRIITTGWNIGNTAVRQMGGTKYLTVPCGIRLTNPCFIQKRHIVKGLDEISISQ
jgi:hypothetical protein